MKNGKGVDDLLRISNKAKLITSIVSKIFVAMLLGGTLLATVVFLQYKPVYTVTYGEEELGYAQNKKALQKNIDNYLQYGDGDNIGYVILKEKPEYSLKLAKKDVETDDEGIYNYIKEQCDVYYKVYAVESNDTEVCRVETLALAQEIVDKESNANY